MTGVFLDTATLQRGDLNFTLLKAVLPTWQFHDTTATAQVAERIAQADVVVSNKAYIGAEALAAAENLKLICVIATGTNNVDLVAAKARGMAVCNVTGYAPASVSQHVFALILALVTQLENYRAAVKSGAWQRASGFSMLDYPIWELAGKTMGIVGYGSLGQAVAHLAEAFCMRVLIAGRPGQPAAINRVPLHDLLRQADAVSLHCPLTEQTRGLIGAYELALMQPHALLINTARGGIVDESALAQALREHRIGGAGVDVLSVEPPVEDNVLLAADIPNLIVTPHIAWASREARQRLVDETANNIAAFLRGVTHNRVV
ncbi:MAG: 2-hydroxyacid dehydrogenase [Gammaproteobacteria bacterium]|nr:2-hydroxyacid dehydrogenase [Gammaproteobacteria bacterium]